MRRGGVTLLALALGASTLAAPASAAPDRTTATRQRQRQIDQQMSTLRSRVAEASAQETALLGELDALDERIDALSQRVGAIDRRIVAVTGDLLAAQGRLDELEARYRRADAELRNDERRLRIARASLRARALVAYTDGPAVSRYTTAFLESGVHELAARTGYLDTVVRNQRTLVDRYRVLRERAEDRADALSDARAAALVQRDVVAAQTDVLQAARREQDAVRQQVLGETNRRAHVLSAVRDRKAEFLEQLAALRAESSSIAAQLRARQRGQTVQPSGRGVLAVPIAGAAITSGFGARRHPIFGDYRTHTGVDFGAGYGTPIRAAADGDVVHAGGRGGYGNTVILDHGGRLATLSAHMSSVLVAAGERVQRGQVIGRVGSTGYSTGPHLHFEVRVSGTPVDPMQYL